MYICAIYNSVVHSCNYRAGKFSSLVFLELSQSRTFSLPSNFSSTFPKCRYLYIIRNPMVWVLEQISYMLNCSLVRPDAKLFIPKEFATLMRKEPANPTFFATGSLSSIFTRFLGHSFINSLWWAKEHAILDVLPDSGKRPNQWANGIEIKGNTFCTLTSFGMVLFCENSD